MENVESDPGDAGKETEEVSQVHVVSQKDIHDFWDHVSTGDRISDVCTTFESESKQVISKLYDKTASMGEKFAVANFLLQIGALQFRVQKNPEDENELQTIIILQKPDIPPSTTEGQDETQPEVKEAINKDVNDDDDDTPQSEGEKEESNLAAWEKEPEEEVKVEEPFVPPEPEEHECPICHTVLTSLWQLDLHILNRCHHEDFSPRKGRPPKRKPEPKAEGSDSDDGETPVLEKRKRGRPRKSAPDTPLKEESGNVKLKRGRPRKSDSTEEVQGSVKRGRGRPPKSDSSEQKQESTKKSESSEQSQESTKKRGRGRPPKVDSLAKSLADESPSKQVKRKITLPKLQLHPLQETRSKRKRRLPMKLRPDSDEEKGMGQEDDTPVVYPADAEQDQLQKAEHNRPENDKLDQPENAEHDQPENAEHDQSENTKQDQPENAEQDNPEHDQSEEKDIDHDEDEGTPAESEMESIDQEETNEDSNEDSNTDVKTDEHGKEKSKKEYKCSTCGTTFKSIVYFRQHLIMHRNKSLNIRFHCEVCSRVFYNEFDLKNHKSVHKKAFKCDYCDKIFEQISHLKRHSNNVHTKEIKYSCTLCDKVFYLKHRLRDHMVTHSGKKEFTCDQCDMKFFLQTQLRTHKKCVHIEGKPYLCDLCGSNFKSKGILKQHHLTVHTDIKKFPCRECGKMFSRSSLRNQHEKVHTGLNPYPCEHCGKGFRDKFKLKVHVNWHLGVHPFSCHLCDKTFLVKGNLTKHMRIHTGERPYVCEQCGRGCVDSSQLKKHMAQAHKIKINRTLTKGPERLDGELPSSRRKRKKTQPQPIAYPEVQTAQEIQESQETQAYTIATDALIEISQQLADMSNTVHLSGHGGELVIAENKIEEGHTTDMQQQAGTGVVASNVTNGEPGAAAPNDSTVFPVMIEVAEPSNQVTIPVTQSISNFQSLELISL